MYHAILFDLDGTLTDSAEGITKSVQYAMEKMNYESPKMEELRVFLGPPLKEQFMESFHLSDSQAVSAVEFYRERYNLVGVYENRPYEGVAALLDTLKKQGYVLGVASSKPEYYVEKILRHFGLYDFFTVVVGSEMNGNRTNKAEVIREALRRLNCENCREQVVMVGDRKYDVIGAANTGIDCIGVAYGYGGWEELNNAGPAAIVSTVQELQDFFQ